MKIRGFRFWVNGRAVTTWAATKGEARAKARKALGVRKLPPDAPCKVIGEIIYKALKRAERHESPQAEGPKQRWERAL